MRWLGLDRFSGLYLWALFIIVFGIWTPSNFLTGLTLHSVASQQVITGMLAFAVLIPMVCGHYDLSVGANANFAGIVAIQVQVSWHWAAVPAILLGILVGLATGLVNAFIVVRLHVNSFIATLGMGSILGAVQVIVTSQLQPPPVSGAVWNNFTQTKVAGFQIVFLYLLIAAVIVWWFLEHTAAGRFLFASGANPDAARLSGVRVDRWSVISLALAGGVAGLAGVFYTSLSGPSLSFGSGLLLPAFAAVFLGSTQLRPGKFNVWGTVIAIYVLATGVKGLQLVSGQSWLSDMFNGVALILAVALAVSRQQRQSRTTPRGRSWRTKILGRNHGGARDTDDNEVAEVTSRVSSTEAASDVH